MTNVQARNAKLRARALRILQDEAGMNEERASEILTSADNNLPLALVMSKTGRSRAEAESALKDSQGVIAQAVERIRQPR